MTAPGETCRLCRSPEMSPLLDFGPQPICNRFLPSPDAPEQLFPLALTQCASCGLIQLAEVAPPQELCPRVDWITYREAEGHLDAMVDWLMNVTGLPRTARVCGVSYKDTSTLDRFRKRDFHNVMQIDPSADLGIHGAGAGIETIQERLSCRIRTTDVAQRCGAADLLVARHILEHAHDLHGFMRGLDALIAPGGFVAFEVPDFQIALSQFDYSTVWEEHAVYFTPSTFARAFRHLGLELVASVLYPYPLENSLVAVARRREAPPAGAATQIDAGEDVLLGRAYRAEFPRFRQRMERYLDSFRREQGPIAIFGAGHLACKFVNLLGLKHLVEFVVDDHPRKKGLYMPGSRLPIQESAALTGRGVRLCLTSLNPESEEKVLSKNQQFVKQGGRFASIFPASPNCLKV